MTGSTAQLSSSPVCVADTFHFSHYYWRELAGTNSNDSSDDESVTALKPKPVAKDTIKLKFYAQGMSSFNLCFLVVSRTSVPQWWAVFPFITMTIMLNLVTHSHFFIPSFTYLQSWEIVPNRFTLENGITLMRIFPMLTAKPVKI